MFEFEKRRKPRSPLSSTVVSTPSGHGPDVAEASFLSWNEHCIECAAPDCYRTCALYESRADGRCRRFTDGIQKNDTVQGINGGSAEITFKTWGKLKANGNTFMEPLGGLRRRSWLIEHARPLRRAFGRLAMRLSANPRWRDLIVDPDRLARRLHHRHGPSRHPDMFLMEIYNPGIEAVAVQLAMQVAESMLDERQRCATIPPPFFATATLEPGYSRHEFPRSAFEPIIASGLPFKLSLVPEGDQSPTLVFQTLDFVTLRTPLAATGRQRREQPATDVKCVVFDLDNTIWRGTLAEGDRIIPDEEVLSVIRELDRRGILLSIASKNDMAPALDALQRIGVSELFLHPQIDWSPKSQSLTAISQKLNISLNTFVFVDDSSFELAEVGRSLPDVTCVAVGEVEGLLTDPRCRGSDSVEAGQRRHYYLDAIERDRQRSAHSDDYAGFLASCRIKLDIEAFEPKDLQRAVELVQRTNQLNFSGTHYSADAISAILADDTLERYVLRCSDNYGSYGTVGLALVRRRADEIRVEEFVLSCRVQGRSLERAFFAELVDGAAAPAPTRLWVNLHPTQRNGPAQELLHDLGFEPASTGIGVTLDLRRHDLHCDFIEISDGRSCRPAKATVGDQAEPRPAGLPPSR